MQTLSTLPGLPGSIVIEHSAEPLWAERTVWNYLDRRFTRSLKLGYIQRSGFRYIGLH
jgi:hypothetical protein